VSGGGYLPYSEWPYCYCLDGYENTGDFQTSSDYTPEGGLTCSLIGR